MPDAAASSPVDRSAGPRGTVLYVGARLPVRSETFVYREVFGLRERGVAVRIASLQAPGTDLGEARLDDLARDAITVYAGGLASVLVAALAELAAHPWAGLRTLAMACRDAAGARGSSLRERGKIMVQALAGLALARRARPLGIGHVHAHMAHAPTTVAMYAASHLGVPFSFTGHANDLFERRQLLEQKLARARYVSCISHWHRAFYRAIVPRSDDAYRVIRCGVEIPPAVEPRDVAAPLRIITIGRLVAKKGFDVLIDAMAMLHEPDVRCTIIGEGEERPTLEARIARLGLGSRVTLAGAMSNVESLRLIREADLFVLPCKVDPRGDKDGIPVSLMEAMAAGLPVISGDLEAIRELVQHERTGLMCPPGDAAALAAAIVRLARDASLRGRLASQGRAWVIEEFSLGVNIARLMLALGRHEHVEHDSSAPTPNTNQEASPPCAV